MSNFANPYAVTDAEFWIKSLIIAGAVIGIYIVALWGAMILWTYRDAKSRYDNPHLPIGAALLVGLFNLPGLLLYFAIRPQEPLVETYNRQLEAEAFLGEIFKQDVCTSCNAPISESFIACPYCRAVLQEPCASCGRNLQAAWTLCPYCTADRPRVAATASASPQPAVPAVPRRSPAAGGVSLNPSQVKKPVHVS